MRSDRILLGITNALVSRNEGVDFLYVGECDLTEEEIKYIRAAGDEISAEYKLNEGVTDGNRSDPQAS